MGFTDENVVEPEVSSRRKDAGGHTRNEVQRTTTEDGASSSGCVSQDSTHRYCLECAPNLWLWQGQCEVQCPNRTYPTTDSASHISVCSWCHYSCKHCDGPNDYECTDCFGDAALFKRSGFENFCYPKALLPTMDTATWYQRTVAVFSIAIVLLLLVIIFMAVNTIRYGNTFHQYKIVKTVEES